jgi:enoyl-CoA hydratase
MTAQHFVRYDVDDRVAVITLDRPEAANATGRPQGSR